MRTRWHSIASLCLCDFWKQSVFSQDIFTSLPRYIFYRCDRTCCKIYL
ncbi:rCG42046, isoform CRA_b [Rattus norvegicus]|uniref:RCG42046, isoform CRA_b n=1 Tax=Rattus norvegicus TaxID=10116 RepID=A6JUY7_RAT|nr:rCG42046, isoform CRA_b [Rattus norvegicus]